MRFIIFTIGLFIEFLSFSQNNDSTYWFSQDNPSKIISFIDSIGINSLDLSLQEYLLTAKAYQNKMRYATALSIINKGLSKYPDDDELNYQKLAIYLSYGKKYQASKLINNLLKADSLNINYLLIKFKLLQNSNKYSEAIPILKQLILLDSTNAYFYQKLGVNFLKTKNKNAAVTYLRKAIKIDSTLTTPYILLAKIFGTRPTISDYDTAIMYINSALLKEPGNPIIINVKADINFTKKYYFQSKPLYKKLLLSGDSTKSILENYGISLFFTKKYLQSKQVLLKAFYLDTTNTKAANFLGLDYFYLTAYDSCLYYLSITKKLLNPNPRTIDLIDLKMAKSYLNIGENKKALNLFLHLLQKGFKQYDGIAKCYDNLGNTKHAIKYYQKYVEYYKNTNINTEWAKQRLRKLKENDFFEN